MTLKKIRISLKNLDTENYGTIIKSLYCLSKSESEEYTKRMNELRNSLYFNFGYIEFHVVKAVGLDVYENEVKVFFNSTD
jgi:hypothetical protein